MRHLWLTAILLIPAPLHAEPHRSLHNTQWYIDNPAARAATIRLCESDAAYMRLTDCANAERASSAVNLGNQRAWKTLGDMFNDPRYWATAGDLVRESARMQCLKGYGPATPYCGPVMQSYGIHP
jgi:hypothetical protein